MSLADQPIILGMMADPKPGNLSAFNFRESAIMNPDSYRPDLAFERLESQRGMMRIAQPQLVIFPRRFLHFHRQRVKELPEASRAS